MPLDGSALVGVVVAVLEGVATIVGGTCRGSTGGFVSCLILVGAVEVGLGTVEPGLGTAEPGLGTVDPGRGTVEIGLGVPTDLGVEADGCCVWGVAEEPVSGMPPPARMGWGCATTGVVPAPPACMTAAAAAACACWAFARRLSSFYRTRNCSLS